MSETGRSRSELVTDVWPDKVLYAATLVLITSTLGFLHGLAVVLLPVTLSPSLPAILTVWPPAAVILLSLAAAAGAALALRRQRTTWTLAAALAGVASLSLWGLGSVLSLAALVFVALARREGEDAATPEEAVAAETWPDKALAASTVLAVAGVLTVGWGLANARQAIAFQGYMPQVAFGWLCVGLGVLALAAAHKLYRQEAAWLGVLAAVGAVLGLALYAVGPILGLGALLLIREARKEDEFAGAPGGGRVQAG